MIDHANATRNGIWAEAQYLREKLAKLEAQSSKTSPTSSASSRYEGQQKQAEWQEAFEAHGRVAPPQREGEAVTTAQPIGLWVTVARASG
jgi:hypothetical protein